MDDFIKTEGEQLNIYDVTEKNHKNIDTECTVKHKKSRRTFLVNSNFIGKGAFGVLYETCEKSECTYVAKVIDKTSFFEKESYNQMIAAGHGLAPTIHEIWNCKNKVMLIMDRINGITLQGFLEEVKIDDSIKSRIIKKVLEAIKSLHSIGIMHGDLHSQNIMVMKDESIIFIDFGHSVYFEKPITDIFVTATDFATLRKDLVKTFPSNNWLNERSSGFQGNNSNFGQKRTFTVGQHPKKNNTSTAAAAAASPAEEFVPVQEKPLPEWLTPNSKENVDELSESERKKIDKAITKIEGDFIPSEDNSNLIEVINTRLNNLSNVIKRKVFNHLKFK
jgi:tRNA A-37 threonylcarbamoyl transferase component Bud32